MIIVIFFFLKSDIFFPQRQKSVISEVKKWEYCNLPYFSSFYIMDFAITQTKLQKFIDYVHQHDIRYFQGFVQLLKEYGIHCSKIGDFIQTFIKENPGQNPGQIIHQITNRFIVKSNSCEKEIIMNCICHQCPIEVYDSFVIFVNKHYNFPESKRQELFKRFKSKIYNIIRRNEENLFTGDFYEDNYNYI